MGITFDSTNNKSVVAYEDANNANGTSVVYSSASTNLTAENFVGITNGVVVSNSQSVGNEAVFESAAVEDVNSAYDVNAQKVVIAYTDTGNSNYGTAVVGTVSGTSISFGTPVVFEAAHSLNNSIVYDANAQKVIISYRDVGNSVYGTSIVGTVSGTNISFGSPVVFETSHARYISSTFDSNSNKVVVVYAPDGNSSYGTARVGTVSGTNISFGTAVVFNSASTGSYLAATFDSNSNKVVLAYRDAGNSSYGTAIVGTVSGTGISFGSEAVFNAVNSTWIATTFDSSSNKVVIAYSVGGSGDAGTVKVGTVSGTSISFGTAVVFETDATSYTSATFDSNSNKVVITYSDAGNSYYGTVISGTVSDTSISFNTKLVFNAGNTDFTSSVFDSTSNKVVIGYRDDGNSSYGTSVIYSGASIIRGSTASGSTAIIQAGGAVNTLQTGLTPGQQYFVQTDGTLGLTAGSPSVIAGTAVSATDLIVKG